MKCRQSGGQIILNTAHGIKAPASISFGYNAQLKHLSYR